MKATSIGPSVESCSLSVGGGVDDWNRSPGTGQIVRDVLVVSDEKGPDLEGVERNAAKQLSPTDPAGASSKTQAASSMN